MPTNSIIRNLKEEFIKSCLFAAALSSILITAGIVIILGKETISFLKYVSLKDFILDPQWTPLFSDKHFGIASLLSGTLTVTGVAAIVAIPLGIIIAVYLSEYATPKSREIIKPALELLAGIPTVIYGYFALLFLTPILQKIIYDLPTFNALSPGIIIGIMIIPYISSLSEDAMTSVPMHIREGSIACGATTLQTAFKVVIPSAFSGIAAAFIMGISRAIGETMVVAIAAGMMPQLSLNPLKPIQTITAYIVQVSLGDAPHNTVEYHSIFSAGSALFCITLFFNIIGFWLKKRIREAY